MEKIRIRDTSPDPQHYIKIMTISDWQPIPVHTVKESEDYLLSSHADCPRFTHLQNELLVSKEFRNGMLLHSLI
jgi:hypothetical protein